MIDNLDLGVPSIINPLKTICKDTQDCSWDGLTLTLESVEHIQTVKQRYNGDKRHTLSL